MQELTPYSVEEFLRDFEALHVLPPDRMPRTPEQRTEMMHSYMSQTYPGDEAKKREAVMLETVLFIAENMESFDSGRIAVDGESQGLVSNFLLVAAHQLISPVVYGIWDEMPNPQQVRELAESFADAIAEAA